MVLFSRLLLLFDKNKAYNELQDEYLYLSETSKKLYLLLNELRNLQNDMVSTNNDSHTCKDKITGQIGLEKTQYIEESLIPALKLLYKKTEHKFFITETEIHTEPLNEDESICINKVKDFLKKLATFIPKIEFICDGHNLESTPDKLHKIYTVLMEISSLSKEYSETE